MASLPDFEVAGPVSVVANPVLAVASQDIDSTLRENRVFPPPLFESA